MKSPLRPETSGANPDEDAVAEDITEFAHSAPTPPLLEPDDDERTLANPRGNPGEHSADLDERPFALVNPPILSAATLAELRAPELPAPSSISTPPAGVENLARRGASRGGTGLLLGLGVLGLVLVGWAVFFKSGQAASSTPVSPPLEAAPVAHAEPSPVETASAPSEPPNPSPSNEALAKAASPRRTVSAATPAAMPRPAVTSPAQSRAVTPTAPTPATPATPIATARVMTNPAPDRAHAMTDRPTSTDADATETVEAPFDRNAAASALAKAAEEAAASCRKPGDPAGTASTTVTFAPSGRVTTALLSGPPFAGTQTGSCIAAALRRARIPAFAGEKVTVGKTIVIR